MNRSKIAAVLVLTVFSLALMSGCSNTMKGAGQDIEKAGQEVQKASD